MTKDVVEKEKKGSLSWKNIKTMLSKILIWFSAILFGVTFLWVLFAAIIWPAQNAQYFRNSYLLDSNRSLEVWGPKIIPGESAAEIRFTLHQKSISKIPLKFFVTIPVELVATSSADEPYTHNAILNFNGNQSNETQTIQIANAHVTYWLVISHKAMVIHQGASRVIGRVLIGVEPTFRSTLRQYGGGGSEIPFFPLTTMFISVAGWAYREFQQKKLDEEKNETQRKERAKSLLEEIRKFIKNGQVDSASQFLDEISQKELRKYLNETDLQTAQRILDTANGNITNTSVKFPDSWVEEAAAALSHVAKQKLSSRRTLDSLLRGFPIDKISNENIRQRLNTARSIAGSTTPAQNREPVYAVETKPGNFKIKIAGLEQNPFFHENANDDAGYLFKREYAAFWSEHPILNTLKNSKGAALVYGRTGSGRTALALALGKYRHAISDQRSVFSCYFYGTPGAEELRITLANQLLSFIERLPSFLILLNEQQRNLFALVLLQQVEKETILSHLEYMSNPEKWQEWLNKTEDVNKRDIWKAETHTHLSLLQEAVSNTTSRAFSDYQWLLAFMTCLRALEFDKPAYIVVDAGSAFNWEWYNEVILRQQHRWLEINLHTIVFHSVKGRIGRGVKNDQMKQLQLDWNEDLLLDMAKWRWNAFYERRSLPSLFETNALYTLIQLSENNPRCFIRLWNKIFGDSPGIIIRDEAIRKAKEQIKCD